MDHSHHDHYEIIKPVSNAKEYSKLAGIFIFLAISALGPSTIAGFDISEWMRWFMGGFFIIFGSFKLIGYEMFIMMFPSYDLLAKKYKIYSWVYPFIEVFLGVLFVLNLLDTFRDITTVLIMGIGSFGILRAIKQQGTIQCACLGNIIRLPLSTVTLVEDGLMLAMALMLLISSIFG